MNRHIEKLATQTYRGKGKERKIHTYIRGKRNERKTNI